jgi:hypothetical protein
MRDKEERINNPKICYYGLINSIKLDYDLMNEIVTYRPNWRFIFIGPILEPVKTNKKLFEENIEFLDTMEIHQLHNYIKKNIDVCFSPYRIDDEPTKAGSSMKLYETLGDGLPFVSTDVFDPLDAKDLISIGKGARDIISKIEYELETDSLEKRNMRLLYAQNNTWKKRASDIMKIIKTIE